MFVMQFDPKPDAVSPVLPGLQRDQAARVELKLRLGEKPDETPARFVAWEADVRLDDFLVSEGLQINFCSKRVVEAVQEAGLTGVEFFPIVVELANGPVVEGYHAIQITGRCGALFQADPKARRGQGLGLDRAEYDGQDLATKADRKGAYPMVVSAKAKDVFDRFQSPVVRFVRLALVG